MQAVSCVGCWLWNLRLHLQKQNGGVANLSGMRFRLIGCWSFGVLRSVWYGTGKAVVFCSLPSPLVVVQELTVLLEKLVSSASLSLTAISDTQAARSR